MVNQSNETDLTEVQFLNIDEDERKARIVDACIIIIHLICTEFEDSVPMQMAQHIVNSKQVPEPCYEPPYTWEELSHWRRAQKALERSQRSSGDLYKFITQRIQIMGAHIRLFEKIR